MDYSLPMGLLPRRARKRGHGQRWFVSHSTPEADIVRSELAQLLPHDEFEFFYQEDPPESAPIAREIFDLMGSCDGVIWADSVVSRKRHWVTWEIDAARRLGLPVTRFRLSERALEEDREPPVPFRIYVSYTRHDRAAVDPVLSGLRDWGVELFWDRQDMIPGEVWKERLDDEMSESLGGFGFVLLFLSRSAEDSVFLDGEVSRALSIAGPSNLPILPVNVSAGAFETLGGELIDELRPFLYEGLIVDLPSWPVGRSVDEIMVRAYNIAYQNAGKR